VALSAALLQLRVHLGGEGGTEAAEEEGILRDPGEKVRDQLPPPLLLSPQAWHHSDAPGLCLLRFRRCWLE